MVSFTRHTVPVTRSAHKPHAPPHISALELPLIARAEHWLAATPCAGDR